MRHGLTLIETVLTIGLLATLAVALSSWLAVTSRSYAGHARSIEWRAAAESVLGVIAEDVAIRDLVPDQRDRVEVHGGLLRIRTRSRGPADDRGEAIHEYELNPALGELRMSVRGSAHDRAEHLLADHVAGVEWDLDEDRRLLSVVISSGDGEQVARVYRLE